MHFYSEDMEVSQPGELWEAWGCVGSDLAPAWPSRGPWRLLVHFCKGLDSRSVLQLQMASVVQVSALAEMLHWPGFPDHLPAALPQPFSHRPGAFCREPQGHAAPTPAAAPPQPCANSL